MVNIEDLEQINILQDMPSHILEILTREAQIQIMGKGTELFHAGQRNETFYMLTKGQVALKIALTPDIDVVFEDLQSGSSFGGFALVKSGLSSYTAVCQDACETITLQAPRMFELFEKNPEFAFYMIRAVAKQYQKLTQERSKMTLRTLETNPDLKIGMERVGTMPRIYSNMYI